MYGLPEGSLSNAANVDSPLLQSQLRQLLLLLLLLLPLVLVLLLLYVYTCYCVVRPALTMVAATSMLRGSTPSAMLKYPLVSRALELEAQAWGASKRLCVANPEAAAAAAVLCSAAAAAGAATAGDAVADAVVGRMWGSGIGREQQQKRHCRTLTDAVFWF